MQSSTNTQTALTQSDHEFYLNLYSDERTYKPLLSKRRAFLEFVKAKSKNCTYDGTIVDGVKNAVKTDLWGGLTELAIAEKEYDVAISVYDFKLELLVASKHQSASTMSVQHVNGDHFNYYDATQKKVTKIKADGHCLYESIAKGLNLLGKPVNRESIRNSVSNSITKEDANAIINDMVSINVFSGVPQALRDLLLADYPEASANPSHPMAVDSNSSPMQGATKKSGAFGPKLVKNELLIQALPELENDDVPDPLEGDDKISHTDLSLSELTDIEDGKSEHKSASDANNGISNESIDLEKSILEQGDLPDSTPITDMEKNYRTITTEAFQKLMPDIFTAIKPKLPSLVAANTNSDAKVQLDIQATLQQKYIFDAFGFIDEHKNNNNQALPTSELLYEFMKKDNHKKLITTEILSRLKQAEVVMEFNRCTQGTKNEIKSKTKELLKAYAQRRDRKASKYKKSRDALTKKYSEDWGEQLEFTAIYNLCLAFYKQCVAKAVKSKYTGAKGTELSNKFLQKLTSHVKNLYFLALSGELYVSDLSEDYLSIIAVRTDDSWLDKVADMIEATIQMETGWAGINTEYTTLDTFNDILTYYSGWFGYDTVAGAPSPQVGLLAHLMTLEKNADGNTHYDIKPEFMSSPEFGIYMQQFDYLGDVATICLVFKEFIEFALNSNNDIKSLGRTEAERSSNVALMNHMMATGNLYKSFITSVSQFVKNPSTVLTIAGGIAVGLSSLDMLRKYRKCYKSYRRGARVARVFNEHKNYSTFFNEDYAKVIRCKTTSKKRRNFAAGTSAAAQVAGGSVVLAVGFSNPIGWAFLGIGMIGGVVLGAIKLSRYISKQNKINSGQYIGRVDAARQLQALLKNPSEEKKKFAQDMIKALIGDDRTNFISLQQPDGLSLIVRKLESW